MTCPVCDNPDLDFLATVRSPRVRGAVPVATCPNCGYVGIHPKPRPDYLGWANATWFNVEAQIGPDQSTAKYQSMAERIAPHYPEGFGAVLDIGARWGDALAALKPGARSLSAVEAVAAFHPRLRELGATVLSEIVGRHDLIVFRHTLEHLDERLAMLRTIAAALSPTGHVYIAVPNAMAPDFGKPMRTDWFRPVHGHYFNRATLIALCARAGLYPRICRANGEVWGLFGCNETLAEEPVFAPAAQRRLLEQRIASARWHDYARMVKIGLLGVKRYATKPAR